MAIRDIPHYTQLTNTCGLSSLLMIAKPEGNSLASLLQDLATKIRVESYYEGPLGWQIAEAYLLMKCCFHRSLKYHLQKNFMDEYAYFRMVLLHQLEERKYTFVNINDLKSARDIDLFLKKGTVRKQALYEYLFAMKTNLELKMLAFLYGGTQILFPSEDGTGCIFLNGKDDNKKLETLYQSVPEGIIIGLGYHWLAVRGMEQIKKHRYNFFIHDPKGEKRTVSSDQIEKNFRFYLFKFDMAQRKKMDVIVRRALNLPRREIEN
jgi:hypothetical protein